MCPWAQKPFISYLWRHQDPSTNQEILNHFQHITLRILRIDHFACLNCVFHRLKNRLWFWTIEISRFGNSGTLGFWIFETSKIENLDISTLKLWNQARFSSKGIPNTPSTYRLPTLHPTTQEIWETMRVRVWRGLKVHFPTNEKMEGRQPPQ